MALKELQVGNLQGDFWMFYVGQHSIEQGEAWTVPGQVSSCSQHIQDYA
jgi:hypothetical protein